MLFPTVCYSRAHADLRPIIYSRRELRLLLNAVPSCHRHAACRTSAITLRTLLLFLYGTGMGVGEALRLRTGEIDLEEGDHHHPDQVLQVKTCSYRQRCPGHPEILGLAGEVEPALPALSSRGNTSASGARL
jgi:hypothetical protein